MVRGIFNKLPHLQISVGYGLTECFAITTSTPYPDALRKIKAVGKCLPTVDAKIVDDDNRSAPESRWCGSNYVLRFGRHYDRAT
jgi:acyl-CoA synthetase (AMP-forming)/AMP-acid ligase II